MQLITRSYPPMNQCNIYKRTPPRWTKEEGYPCRLAFGGCQGAWTELFFQTARESWRDGSQWLEVRRSGQSSGRHRLELVAEIVDPLQKLLQIVNCVPEDRSSVHLQDQLRQYVTFLNAQRAVSRKETIAHAEKCFCISFSNESSSISHLFIPQSMQKRISFMETQCQAFSARRKTYLWQIEKFV